MQEKTNNRLLFIIFLTVFLNLLGITIVIPVLAPLFLNDSANSLLGQGYSFGEITFILGLLKASYPVMQFFGSPILGTLSDKIGRKKTLTFTLIGSLIGYVIFAIGIMERDLSLLFLGRIIDGATGGNIAVIYSAIADISTRENKTKNFGLVGMAFGIGFILGPFIGGITSNPEIVSWFDFSTPFWFAALLILINLFLVKFWFPETLKQKRDLKIRPFTGIKNISRSFRIPGMGRLFAVIFLMFSGFTFFTQFFDVYLIKKFDYEQAHIGQMFAYIGLWITIAQGGLARITSRYFSSVKILKISLLGVVLSLGLLLLPENHFYLLLILPFLSLFHGLNQPNLLSVLSNSAGEDIQGEVLGVNQSLQSLAISLPPIIAGLIISIDISLPIWVSAGLIFVAWVLFITRPPKN